MLRWTTLIRRPSLDEAARYTKAADQARLARKIGFFYALNPDCSASGDVNIRATKQPEHGTAEITTATNFPGDPKESDRYKCNQLEVKGMQVSYKSAEKYVGDDALDLLVLFPAGTAWEVRYDVSVR